MTAMTNTNRVYGGTWNPVSGAYPLHNGDGCVWDVVLNDGVENFKFDGIVWGGGHRVGYDAATKTYHQITSNAGVHSVNGKNGAVVLSFKDVGARPETWMPTPADVNAVPLTRKVNNKALDKDVNLTHVDVGAVPLARKVNGKSLNADINLTPADVGAVSATTEVNGKPLSKSIALTSTDVGALPLNGTAVLSTATEKFRTPRKISGVDFDGSKDITLEASNVGAVPITRKINGKLLSGDVTLKASDVSALSISGGTLTDGSYISTSGKLQVTNPDNVSANCYLTYVNGTPSVRYGGVGEGSTAGFQVVGVGGAVKFKVDNNGELFAKGTSKVYHEGFKPAPSDIGAAPAEDLAPELPFPDVWIPFNDNLRMLAGYGEDIKVGDETVATKVSFSRASTATYIDKSGVLRTAAVNEPRFEKEGLLIEGQSTNFVKYGEDMTLFSNSNSSLVKNGDWFDFVENDQLSSHTCATNAPVSGEGVHTASVLAKPLGTGEKRYLAISLTSGARVTFDLENGTAKAVNNPVSYSIKKKGDAWLCSASVNAEAAGNFTVSFRLSDKDSDGLHSYQGDGVSGVSLKCPQLEALPFATSYIPTNGAAATRAADNVWIPTAGNVPFIGRTIVAEVSLEKPIATYNPGGANSRRCIYGAATSADFGYCSLYINNPLGDPYLSAIEGDSGSELGFVNKFKDSKLICGLVSEPGRFLSVLNGNISVAPDRNPVTSLNSQVYIGSQGSNGTRTLWGHIRNFRIWHRALSDAQLKYIR